MSTARLSSEASATIAPEGSLTFAGLQSKYQKLKQRWYSQEQKVKDLQTKLDQYSHDLHLSSERHEKARYERDVLLDRIMELESIQRHQQSSQGMAIPRPQPLAYHGPPALTHSPAQRHTYAERFSKERESHIFNGPPHPQHFAQEERPSKRSRSGGAPPPSDHFDSRQLIEPPIHYQRPPIPVAYRHPSPESYRSPAIGSGGPPHPHPHPPPPHHSESFHSRSPGSPRRPTLEPHNPYPAHSPPHMQHVRIEPAMHPVYRPHPAANDHPPMQHTFPVHMRSSSDSSLVNLPPESLKLAKPKRLKAHTVKTKSHSVPLVPRDPQGRPHLPLNVGIMTLMELGTICTKEHFHTERYIYPVGYKVARRFLSTVNPDSDVVYKCTILDGGDGPRFQIISDDVPDRPVIAGTATGAWSSIVKAANQIRNRQHSNSVSGPDFFGLSQTTIRHLIQELPEAGSLRDYVWQNYIEGGDSVAPRSRANTKEQIGALTHSPNGSDSGLAPHFGSPVEQDEGGNGVPDTSRMAHNHRHSPSILPSPSRTPLPPPPLPPTGKIAATAPNQNNSFSREMRPMSDVIQDGDVMYQSRHRPLSPSGGASNGGVHAHSSSAGSERGRSRRSSDSNDGNPPSLLSHRHSFSRTSHHSTSSSGNQDLHLKVRSPSPLIFPVDASDPGKRLRGPGGSTKSNSVGSSTHTSSPASFKVNPQTPAAVPATLASIMNT